MFFIGCVWLWNVISYLDGKTYLTSFWKQTAQQNIWIPEGRSENYMTRNSVVTAV